MSDLRDASRSLAKALEIRDRYMQMGMQSFPRTAARFVNSLNVASGVYGEVESNAGVFEADCDSQSDSGMSYCFITALP